MLVERHLSISPFAPLLICAYPVIEALYSIARRIQNKASSGAPDRSHLHHLFKMGLVKPWLKDCDLSSVKSNSIAGLSVSLLSVPFMALALYFQNQHTVLIGLFALELAMYCWMYLFLRSKQVRYFKQPWYCSIHSSYDDAPVMISS